MLSSKKLAPARGGKFRCGDCVEPLDLLGGGVSMWAQDVHRDQVMPGLYPGDRLLVIAETRTNVFCLFRGRIGYVSSDLVKLAQ